LRDCKYLDFYCEVIEIHTSEEGSYAITSNSTIDIVGYVYENDFVLFDLLVKQIRWQDDMHNNNQFRITLHRQMNTSFILIVTTKKAHEQGVFSITVKGPGNVSIRRKSMCSFSFLIYMRIVILLQTM